MQISDVVAILDRVRERAPLVHNITNYVVMNNTANALLAFGASPAMVHAAEEVEEFTALASALVINIGTLSGPWVAAMRLSAITAQRFGRPWVLDPVGVGATRYRTGVAADLVGLKPTVVRGNASEVMTLAGAAGTAPKGVDSVHGSDAAMRSAIAFAAEHGLVAAVTGAVDVVTNGQRTLTIEGGDPLMARVTGLGCTASALVAACLAVEPDPLVATVAALAALKAAGKAAAEVAGGPGSLQVALLDMLHALDAATLEAHVVVRKL